MELKNIIQNIRKLLTDPIKFFEKYRAKEWIELIEVIAVMEVIPAIVITALINISMPLLLRLSSKFLWLAELGIFSLPIVYIFLFVTAIFCFLLGSFILHIGVYLTGKGEIIKTATVNVYASIPSLLLFWIPGINILASIWSYVLLIVGISKQHKISYIQTILALIYSMIVSIVIFGIMLLLIGGPLFSFLSESTAILRPTMLIK
jgi:hypothetical protein